MSSCRAHHDEHGGDAHSHAGHDHHDHDHSDDIAPALKHSLYSVVYFDHIITLNESRRDSGRRVVEKTWADRLEIEPELVSDADEQLLMTVPFTGQVKLHSILLRTSDSPSAPCTLKLFANSEIRDFDDVDGARPTQTLDLARSNQVQEIPVRRAMFSTLRQLTLFFSDNFSSGDDDVEMTRITYLAFRGEWMSLGRAPERIVYEAAANPSDHKVDIGAFKLEGGNLGM